MILELLNGPLKTPQTCPQDIARLKLYINVHRQLMDKYKYIE